MRAVQQCILCISLMMTAIGQAYAAYPERPVKVIVPVAPGGGTDTSARIFFKYAAPLLGQSIVVENINGNSGYRGSKVVFDDGDDGYTLLYTHEGLITAHLTGISPYSFNAFSVGPTVVRDNTLGFYVSPRTGITDLAGLIRHAKAYPGQVNAATEYGAFTYYLFLKIAKELGVRFNLVDVGGGAAKIQALKSGYVDLLPAIYSGSIDELIKAEIAIPLGIPAQERQPNAPMLPTFKEQGVDLEFPPYYWTLFFNQDTHDEVIATWNRVASEVAKNPEYQKDVASLNLVPVYVSSANTRLLLTDIEKELRELGKNAATVTKQQQ